MGPSSTLLWFDTAERQQLALLPAGRNGESMHKAAEDMAAVTCLCVAAAAAAASCRWCRAAALLYARPLLEELWLWHVGLCILHCSLPRTGLLGPGLGWSCCCQALCIACPDAFAELPHTLPGLTLHNSNRIIQLMTCRIRGVQLSSSRPDVGLCGRAPNGGNIAWPTSPMSVYRHQLLVQYPGPSLSCKGPGVQHISKDISTTECTTTGFGYLPVSASSGLGGALAQGALIHLCLQL